MKNVKFSRGFGAAIANAKRFAIQGPRIAAVAIVRVPRLKYVALPGFIDRDEAGLEQVLLVTPDGREWTAKKQ